MIPLEMWTKLYVQEYSFLIVKKLIIQMSNNCEVIKLGFLIKRIYEHLKLSAKVGVSVCNFHQLQMLHVLIIIRKTK